jgi:hypothetical protein
MDNQLQFPGGDRDVQLASAIEPLLVPPVDDAAYWAGLHARIMARVSEAALTSSWWVVPPTVARAGMLAAAIALLVLGALAVQDRELETRMAFEAVTETELEVARILPNAGEPYGAVTGEPAARRR